MPHPLFSPKAAFCSWSATRASSRAGPPGAPTRELQLHGSADEAQATPSGLRVREEGGWLSLSKGMALSGSWGKNPLGNTTRVMRLFFCCCIPVRPVYTTLTREQVMREALVYVASCGRTYIWVPVLAQKCRPTRSRRSAPPDGRRPLPSCESHPSSSLYASSSFAGSVGRGWAGEAIRRLHKQ